MIEEHDERETICDSVVSVAIRRAREHRRIAREYACDARIHVHDDDLTSFSEFTGGRMSFAGQDA